MPRTISPAVVATAVKLLSISFAWEPRGTPPVSTLITIETYQVRDAAGAVLEIKHVGRNTPPGALLGAHAAITAAFSGREAAITTEEGI